MVSMSGGLLPVQTLWLTGLDRGISATLRIGRTKPFCHSHLVEQYWDREPDVHVTMRRSSARAVLVLHSPMAADGLGSDQRGIMAHRNAASPGQPTMGILIPAGAVIRS
jgi:hypothetical protein